MKTAKFFGLGFFCALVILSSLPGCDNGGQSAAPKPTKGEWKAKLVRRFGGYAQLGILQNIELAEFKNAMGEPDHTQTVEGYAYWYYECSDGTIQLALIDGYLNNGEGYVSGNVNDY